MKKIIRIFLLVFILGLNYNSKATAQSTVYFFTGSIANAECHLKQNGKEIFELRGPLKKVFSLATPYKIYSPCKKKCVFKSEGKTLFSVDYIFTNANNGAVTKIAAEIQLNLTEGSVHYVKLVGKGVNDMQFKELTQKEAEKLLKNKKYIFGEEYTEI